MTNKTMQVVEEKVELIKEESPWKEEIEQLSNKKSNLTNQARTNLFGRVGSQKSQICTIEPQKNQVNLDLVSFILSSGLGQ